MKRIAFFVLVFNLSFYFQANGQSGVITTVAGNGTFGISDDGVPAISRISVARAVQMKGLGRSLWRSM